MIGPVFIQPTFEGINRIIIRQTVPNINDPVTKNISLYLYHIDTSLVSGERDSKIRYDTRCYFNVRSKADISQLNLPHGTDN